MLARGGVLFAEADWLLPRAKITRRSPPATMSEIAIGNMRFRCFRARAPPLDAATRATLRAEDPLAMADEVTRQSRPTVTASRFGVHPGARRTGSHTPRRRPPVTPSVRRNDGRPPPSLRPRPGD